MKKLLLLIVLAIAGMTTNLNAQDWSGKVYQFGKVYPGYIIKLTGDTVQGFVEHQDRTGNQKKCLFYTDPNNKKSKVVYKVDDIKGYKVGDKVYRAINYSGGLFGKPLAFNLLTKDGHIAQYMWYSEVMEITMRGGNETVYEYDKRKNTEMQVYQKGTDQPFDHQKFGLKWGKVMAELVSDDKELAQKITNKEEGYGMFKHYEIIDEYNAWYEKNKK